MLARQSNRSRRLSPTPGQVDGVDLKIAPVQRAVGVVVIDLAGAARVLGPLNGQGDAALRTEFVAGVLLIGGQMVAELVGLRFDRVPAGDLGSYHERPLQVDSYRRLQAECVAVAQDQDCERCGHGHQQDDAGKNGRERSGRGGPSRPPGRAPWRRFDADAHLGSLGRRSSRSPFLLHEKDEELRGLRGAGIAGDGVNVLRRFVEGLTRSKRYFLVRPSPA